MSPSTGITRPPINRSKLIQNRFFHLFPYWFRFESLTSIYRSTGILCSNFQLVPILTVKSDKIKWLKAIKPVVAARYLHDYRSGMPDTYFNIGIIFDFIKQGYLTLAWDIIDDESWEGTPYDTGGVWGNWGLQLFKWLNLHICFSGP